MLNRAIETLKSVLADDRTAKLSFALGAGYEQIKDTKDAVTAYQQGGRHGSGQRGCQSGLLRRRC